MKNIFLLILPLIGFIACSKQNAAPTAPVDDRVDSTTATIKYSGMFELGREGTVSGTANIYLKGNSFQLELKDFSVSNGPDLHVYLAQDKDGIRFIELGKLRSTNGNMIYDIPNMPDFSLYKYALIYCQQYSVLFGSAELK